ncbi:cytochrome O ubiquinol oxidase [Defluviimonas sp. 20V17]|uniref:Cytochrome bo(3) ubiquinol oxidase subunit 3 n=1 Tax=Allgaiera indica TaxID=765699 RepID=A0AAN4UV98_9RHOB|nr:cytochrome c oxidase subunit 3 [Allgaiera indica]KDB04213.1 cytochrome O ubiquinol oxidase [Defluviimonas sp. 20V17]GHE06468.1 cytochrome o ubiquinol oxidase subunit III [Allgaiera indica]SDX93846.1 cytochrome bo3 quinol oxidase subunit 3 [Allgaiera indica]
MSRAPTRHPGLNLGPSHQSADDAASVEVFGFWVFMMSDAVVFGLLFATYAVMVGRTAGGPGPSELYDLKSVFIETLALLTSSMTFGIGATMMKHGNRAGWLVFWLVASFALAALFLGFELHDFVDMVHKGGVPQRSGYLSAFWALVPLHGLHVTMACIWMGAILLQMAKYGLDDAVKTAVLRLGILWHFLDIVWIAIFTVVYVGGLA